MPLFGHHNGLCDFLLLLIIEIILTAHQKAVAVVTVTITARTKESISTAAAAVAVTRNVPEMIAATIIVAPRSHGTTETFSSTISSPF